MKERFNLIWNILVDMLAVYGLLVLALKYFPIILPFSISLDMVAVAVLALYVVKVLFTKTIKVKSSEVE